MLNFIRLTGVVAVLVAATNTSFGNTSLEEPLPGPGATSQTGAIARTDTAESTVARECIGECLRIAVHTKTRAQELRELLNASLYLMYVASEPDYSIIDPCAGRPPGTCKHRKECTIITPHYCPAAHPAPWMAASERRGMDRYADEVLDLQEEFDFEGFFAELSSL